MPREYATINVFGPDRTGVVARVTSFVFGFGGNIEELIEQVSRRDSRMDLATSRPPDYPDGRLRRNV